MAVSGGVDSMVLLRILADAATVSGWKLQVAHFNHQLRGAASHADERLVAATSCKLGLLCHVGCGDVRKHAKEAGVSIEMAARQLRHRFLAGVSRKTRSKVVALAHQADDQVETFFLKALRGAGGEGLGAMGIKSPSPWSRRFTVIRPLLGESKTAIEAFAREQRIRFREDASNADESIPRNRVRKKLLPVIREQFGGHAFDSLPQTMAIVREESRLASSLASEWISSGSAAPLFDALHVAVQRQVIRLQLIQLGLTPAFDLIERLREVPGEQVSAEGRLVLRASETGKVMFGPSSEELEFRAGEVELKTGAKGTAHFEGVDLSWRLKRAPKPFRIPARESGVEVFDVTEIGTKVLLRHWQPGDRFQPIGMPVPVKLQDLFVNARISSRTRRAAVVACAQDGRIFWVEGLRIGEQFKVGTASRKLLEWRWNRHKSQS